MLPPGHIAGGYLAGKIAAAFIPQLNQPQYLALSSFFGFFPDLDFLVVFFKAKRFISDDSINHRKFLSHAPLLYLLAFAIWYEIFPGTRLVALTFLVGTMSHFILDTVSSAGIMWLYPFSSRRFGFAVEEKIPVSEKRFIRYWKEFIKKYSQKIAFKQEILIIIIAIIWLASK